MSFLSMAHMYQVVRDMYDSPKWREKVLHMTDNQIMAVYFSKEERDKARAERKKSLKNTLKKKIEESRSKNLGSFVEGCDEAVASSTDGCGGSTDDENPQQLSFFD